MNRAGKPAATFVNVDWMATESEPVAPARENSSHPIAGGLGRASLSISVAGLKSELPTVMQGELGLRWPESRSWGSAVMLFVPLSARGVAQQKFNVESLKLAPLIEVL